MRYTIDETWPQTAHVVLKDAGERDEFLAFMDKFGAEKMLAVTSDVEEAEAEKPREIHEVLDAVRKLGRGTLKEITRETSLGSALVEEKLETLTKAGRIKKRMAGDVAHYKPAKKVKE